jgi:hypothetical protein
MGIELLDKMQDALAQYHMSNIDDIELFKRIIELHESNKPKPEPINGYKLEELLRKCNGDFIKFARSIEQLHDIGFCND